MTALQGPAYVRTAGHQPVPATAPNWRGWGTSRARVSRVMGLLNLAPDLQEQVLFLPRTQQARGPLLLADLLPLS